MWPRAIFRWFASPWGFAVCAVAAWLTWLALPGIGSGGLGWQPVARWDPARGAPWQYDAAKGSAVLSGVRLSVDRSPGISIEFAPGTGSVQVAVMWRHPTDTGWTGRRFQIPLARPWAYFDLSQWPGWSGQLTALAVATTAGEPFALRAVTVEAPGPLAEWSRAWRRFQVLELFDTYSINVLTGAQLGATPWTSVVAGTVAAFLLLRLLAAAQRRRRLDWHGLVALALGAWIALDLRFTADLLANARLDATRFPVLADADAVVSDDDPAYGAVVRAVQEHVPPQAPIAFLTDDPRYAHKAQYVFFPRPVVNWEGRLADWTPEYLVVFRSRLQFDAERGVLHLPNGGELPARLVAPAGDQGLVLAVAAAEGP